MQMISGFGFKTQFKGIVLILVVSINAACSSPSRLLEISEESLASTSTPVKIAGQQIVLQKASYIVQRSYYSALGKTCVILKNTQNNKKERACYNTKQKRYTLLPRMHSNV